MLAPGDNSSQLHQWVGPVSGDYRFVGKAGGPRQASVVRVELPTRAV
jgi:hypothetical protein